MSLYLFIAAAIGLTIFIFAYLIVISASFKHHTVTGLISLIPGINLAVLPSIWSKTRKAFPLSIFGLVIALASWYSGGNQYFLANQTSNKPSIEAHGSNENKRTFATSKKIKELPLPPKPIFYIVYQQVAISELASLTNQYIRVVLIDDRELEGKNIKTTADALLLETHEADKSQILQISPQHIKRLEKLVQTKN